MKHSLLEIGIVVFCASVLKGMYNPERRGLTGFLSAGISGVMCGIITGLLGNAAELPHGLVLLTVAISAIVGDRLVFTLLDSGNKVRIETINNHGVANIGDNNIEGGENVEN